jgi:hypothetical protein
VVMALTPLMVGRLDEGLRGEIKRGIKAWSEDLAWHPEVGGWEARGGWRRRGEAATVGRRGEEDGADRRAPHGSDMREREKASLPECAKLKRIRLSENTPTRLGPSGEPAACGPARGRGWVMQP